MGAIVSPLAVAIQQLQFNEKAKNVCFCQSKQDDLMINLSRVHCCLDKDVDRASVLTFRSAQPLWTVTHFFEENKSVGRKIHQSIWNRWHRIEGTIRL
uniref:Uncharacterized protein n=1 Tax=Trichogramma kaykai TaxID=54128 RepID=A0ABD2WED2_9HYME